ncbi:hypothetical protein HMN09_00713000 [Mycena chlorophos]|uniref:Uncharacterized protein n=2 Tax=Mycena chlorophos TaxID=658473 RepID=A0A146HF49_MYCCL|nr:hypothetical protein HMN09_00713000 [Mycena chlorophos]GAT46757.1 predicted protein [Mycena chlorophos]
MHPRFFSYGYRHHWHTGPSRLVWFVLGAASATWWIHRKQHHAASNEQHFGRCIRQPIPPLQNDPPAPAPAPPAPNPMPWGYPEAHRARQFDEEIAKVKEIGKQAEDVMAKLSEDALDSALSTMEALKRKLAEHREQRLRAQRELEKQVQEQQNNPHRFV